MKKLFIPPQLSTYFPAITAALLSVVFAFASMHYATHHVPTSTSGRLYLWFASLK